MIDLTRNELAALGQKQPNDKLFKMEKTIKDTLFFGSAATIPATNELFTGTASKPAYWRTPNFPNNSQGNIIFAIQILPYVLFSTTDSTDEPTAVNELATFCETTYLKLMVEGSEYINEPISKFVPQHMINSPSPTDEAAAWISAERRTIDSAYQLIDRIAIGAGTTFDWSLNTTGTYVTETVGATNYLKLPGSGLTNEKGYAIVVKLSSINLREIR